jgi:hypothetical protein
LKSLLESKVFIQIIFFSNEWCLYSFELSYNRFFVSHTFYIYSFHIQWYWHHYCTNKAPQRRPLWLTSGSMGM